MKKIGLFCLCLASLSLAGCFHIPDEDWLLSNNKAETGDVKDNEMDEAINSFMDGIDMISSDWNELKNKGNEEEELVPTEGNFNETDTETEDTIIDNENVDGTGEDITIQE